MRRLFVFYFIILLVGSLAEEKEVTNSPQKGMESNEVKETEDSCKNLSTKEGFLQGSIRHQKQTNS